MQQIKGCSAFLESLKFCDEPFRNKSMASLATSIAAQIRNIKDLDVNMAAAMNVEVAGSAFTDELKALITQAAGERCMQSGPQHPVSRKPTQTLLKVENFFTAMDIATFSDNSLAAAQKVARMSHRLALLGVSNPSEATVRNLVAMLACMHAPDATASNLHSLVLDLKRVVHQQAASTRGGPTHYPDEPKDLPVIIHTAAYSADDPPVQQQLLMLPALIGRVPLRSTNKAIMASSSSSSSSSTSVQNPMNMFQAMLNNMMMQQNLRVPNITYTSEFGGTSPPKVPQPMQVQEHLRASASFVMPGTAFVPPPSVQPMLAIGDAAASASQPDSGHAAQADKDTAAAAASAPAKKDPPAEDAVARLEVLAAGRVVTELVAKKPAAAASAPAKKGPPALKRPAAAAAAAANTGNAKKLKLGCSKCRYGTTGCSRCRNPTFSGARRE